MKMYSKEKNNEESEFRNTELNSSIPDFVIR